MTQKEKIRFYLLKDGKINNFFCLENKLTIRLGAIIHELRKEGMPIEGAYIGDTKNYQYTLAQ